MNVFFNEGRNGWRSYVSTVGWWTISTGSYDYSEGHAAKSCEDSDSLREHTQSPTGEMYSIT